MCASYIYQKCIWMGTSTPSKASQAKWQSWCNNWWHKNWNEWDDNCGTKVETKVEQQDDSGKWDDKW